MTTNQTNAAPSNSQGKVFKEAFNSLLNKGREIPFNPEWSNSTGYYDYVVRGEAAPILAPGEIACSRSNNDRRLIIVGTRMGNACVFDRYSGQDDGGVYVSNTPSGMVFEALLPIGSVGEITMIRFVGSWGDTERNLGWLIEQIAENLGA